VISFVLQIFYITVIFCCLLPFVMCPFTMYLTTIHFTFMAQNYLAGVAKLAAQPTVLP